MGSFDELLGNLSSFDFNIGGILGESNLGSAFSGISNLQSIVDSKFNTADAITKQLKEGSDFHSAIISKFQSKIDGLKKSTEKSINAMKGDETKKAQTALLKLSGSPRSDFGNMINSALKDVGNISGELKLVLSKDESEGTSGTSVSSNVFDFGSKIEQVQGMLDLANKKLDTSVLPSLKGKVNEKAVTGKKLESKLKKLMGKIGGAGKSGGIDFSAMAGMGSGKGGGYLGAGESVTLTAGQSITMSSDINTASTGENIHLSNFAIGGNILNGIGSNHATPAELNNVIDGLSSSIMKIATMGESNLSSTDNSLVNSNKVSHNANAMLNEKLANAFNKTGGGFIADGIKDKINNRSKNKTSMMSQTLCKDPNYLEKMAGTSNSIISKGSVVGIANGPEDLKKTLTKMIYSDDSNLGNENKTIKYNIKVTSSVGSKITDPDVYIKNMSAGGLSKEQLKKEWKSYTQAKRTIIYTKFGYDNENEFVRQVLN